MTLTAANGPLGPQRAGRFSIPVPDAGFVYVEPHPRRVQGFLDGQMVIDTESVLMVHRPGKALSYVFLPGDVGDLPTEPEPEAPGYVGVPWLAVDEWFEEGRRLVHYPPNPYHRVDCRPVNRRLVVSAGDTVLVDTADTIILFETGIAARLYVDKGAVRTDLLQRSDTTSYCNYKGVATYWTVVVGDSVIEDAAWSYEDTLPESKPIEGYLSFDAERVDMTAELPAPPR